MPAAARGHGSRRKAAKGQEPRFPAEALIHRPSESGSGFHPLAQHGPAAGCRWHSLQPPHGISGDGRVAFRSGSPHELDSPSADGITSLPTASARLGRNDAVGSVVLAGSSFARASSFARYGPRAGPRLAHSSSCERICGAITSLPTASFRPRERLKGAWRWAGFSHVRGAAEGRLRVPRQRETRRTCPGSCRRREMRDVFNITACQSNDPGWRSRPGPASHGGFFLNSHDCQA